MRTIRKMIFSAAAFLVVLLVAAAAVELSFGEARPGLTPLIVLVLAGPLLYMIWRKPVPSHVKGEVSREEMIVGLRRMIDDPQTTADRREWASSRLATLDKRKG